MVSCMGMSSNLNASLKETVIEAVGMSMLAEAGTVWDFGLGLGTTANGKTSVCISMSADENWRVEERIIVGTSVSVITNVKTVMSASAGIVTEFGTAQEPLPTLVRQSV